jgi:hypothetical protein
MQIGWTVEFGAAFGDFGIESFDADTQPPGFAFTEAVVFGG